MLESGSTLNNEPSLLVWNLHLSHSMKLFECRAADVAACYSALCLCVRVCVFYIMNTVCHLTGSVPGAVPVRHTLPWVPLLGFLCAWRAHRHSSVPPSLPAETTACESQETTALLTRASVSVCLCVCVSISPHCWGPGWLCRGLAPGTSLGEGCRRSWGFGCLVRTRGKTNKQTSTENLRLIFMYS